MTRNILFINSKNLICTLFFFIVVTSYGQITSFPGAEGFGKYATGGRGGDVIFVTNLNNSGAGSLRAACEATGPRTVIFKIGGTINVNTAIVISNPNITIAGQTAPGGGICLKMNNNITSGNLQAPMVVTTSHVIIRGLRFRPGPSNSGLNAQLNDCFDIWSGENIIIDHCSFTWGEDENFTIWADNSQPKKITIQKSIIGSGLRKQGTAQGYGLLIGGQVGADEVSIIDNLFIHNMQRNPLLNSRQVTRTVMYNNVIYNYGYFGTSLGELAQLDLYSNYYLAGNNTTTARYEVLIRQQGLLYTNGNIGIHRPSNASNQWDIVGFNGTIPPDNYCESPASTSYQSLNPFSPTPPAISTANQAYNDLIASQDVGANFKLDDSGNGAYVNNIDAIDAALISDLLNNTGQPVYDTDIGTTVNYPFLNPGTAPTDTDNDGMPDVWENACGLNPGNPNDRNNIALNGYTNLENYLNNVSCGVINPSVTCNIEIWLEGAFDLNTIQLNNSLQQIGILPSGQPYNVAPWNYNGTEGGGWQQSDYPAGAIDWVLISLRATPQACSEVTKVAALLMEDGSIVPAPIDLTGISETAFYIVVEHRNHIPAMTPTAIPLVNNTLSYDFRTADSYTTGTGFGQTQLGTQWAMFAGDISQDSPVGYEVTGADQILWQAANGNFSVYTTEDTNMDGDVNGMDRILLNLNNGISSAVKKCTNTGNVLGCSNAGDNGDLSIEVPMPPGGASWDPTSPFWSVMQAGSPFNHTPYIGTGPYAFSLNGLPDGNYCANFEATVFDANGAALPLLTATCCFIVDSSVPLCSNGASPAPFFTCPGATFNAGDPLSIDLAVTLPQGADSVTYQLINGSGTIQGSNYVVNSLSAGVHPVEIERCYSTVSQDRRTRLLNSPNRMGYGASATGGTNYVFPTNEGQFRQMIAQPGNYVVISSTYANTEWGMRGVGYIASNVTIDGSEAPGFALFPDYSNGFPSTAAGNSGAAVLSSFNDNNIIIHALILKGYRSGSYNSSHPSYNTGGMNLRSTNIFVDHVEITDFWDDAITSAQAGDYITLSHLKIHNTDKGIQFYLPYNGNWDRHYTIHNSLLAGRQRNPWNTGAHFLHIFNNLIQDADYGAVIGGRLQSQGAWTWSGDCYTISERNVYLNNLTYDMRGYNAAVIVEGHIESVNDSYSTSNGTVTNSASPTLFSINYSYNGFLKNTSAVQAYVLQHAGAIPSNTGGASQVCAQQTCCITVDP